MYLFSLEPWYLLELKCYGRQLDPYMHNVDYYYFVSTDMHVSFSLSSTVAFSFESMLHFTGVVPFWPLFLFYRRRLRFLTPKRQNGLTHTGLLTTKIIMDSSNKTGKYQIKQKQPQPLSLASMVSPSLNIRDCVLGECTTVNWEKNREIS